LFYTGAEILLTRKQQLLLSYVTECLNIDGVSPSFEEMKSFLGLRSKSGVHRLVKALEERGFIERLPNRARALRIKTHPTSNSILSQPDPKSVLDDGNMGVAPNIVQGNFPSRKVAIDINGPSESQATSVPLLGRIAAGTPIEALQNPGGYITLPDHFTSDKDHYALEVSGDSMTGVGIIDGDIVIIERCETADNGSIIVALIQEQEATLKRLRRKGNSVALESANPSYETRIFGPEQVKIQGVLRGLLRKY
tara:strand:+ start:2935 stop:3690 length:756 start_codon:yes stop_codon:yes gene_type:complete